MSKEFKVYFAGELFSLKHLLGNAALAEAIHVASSGKYISLLPQSLEQRETTTKAIRNQDISTLINCDLGLFNFDGDEIDSGTVVEYMIAKFLDIPTVILRTDFRSGGDQREGDPWNLMMSFYPRTKVITYDGLQLYQQQLETTSCSVEACNKAISKVAADVVEAFAEVQNEPPVLTEELRGPVYDWMKLMPGGGFNG